VCIKMCTGSSWSQSNSFSTYNCHLTPVPPSLPQGLPIQCSESKISDFVTYSLIEQHQQLQYWSRKFLRLFKRKVQTLFTKANVRTSVVGYLLAMKLNACKTDHLGQTQTSAVATIYGKDKLSQCVISTFHHGVNEIFTLLGCYTVLVGSSLPIGCPEPLVTNYQLKLHNIPRQQRSRLSH
jgi:hypothetical protein